MEVEEAATADPKKEPAQDGVAASVGRKLPTRALRLPENCVEVQRPGRTLTLIRRPRPEVGGEAGGCDLAIETRQVIRRQGGKGSGAPSILVGISPPLRVALAAVRLCAGAEIVPRGCHMVANF